MYEKSFCLEISFFDLMSSGTNNIYIYVQYVHCTHAKMINSHKTTVEYTICFIVVNQLYNIQDTVLRDRFILRIYREIYKNKMSVLLQTATKKKEKSLIIKVLLINFYILRRIYNSLTNVFFIFVQKYTLLFAYIEIPTSIYYYQVL